MTAMVRLLRYVLPRRFWYRSLYLRSPHWRAIRKRKIIQSGFRCEKCGKFKRLDVHHLTYARIFHERLSDLQALCRSCHQKEHEKSNYAKVQRTKKERSYPNARNRYPKTKKW